MGYQMWCEAVRSSILATAWLLVLIFAVFDVPLCSDVKSLRPKWPRGQKFVLGLGLSLKEAISYLVVLWNRASIYIGFWRWALGILQYPSRKRILYFQRGPRLKKVTEGPGRLRYATA